MEEISLSNEELKQLRSRGILSENEIAFLQGDLLVAFDVLTTKRRTISKDNLQLIEGATYKRLLKG
jgi:hypothetical protein